MTEHFPSYPASETQIPLSPEMAILEARELHRVLTREEKPYSAGVLADCITTIENLLSRHPAQGSGMPWERAETASVDANAFYLVKDNGGEWHDFDLHIMRGTMVNHKLAPQYVRGRPEWIAKVNAPAMSSTHDRPPQAWLDAKAERDAGWPDDSEPASPNGDTP